MKHQKSVLKNGLRVITAPMPRVESVSLAVFVGAGSRYEKKSQNGIAHFLEHLVFKGSEKYPSALALSRVVEGTGGVLNGGTDAEAVAFWVKVPRARLELGADVLFDMVLHPLLDQEALERERGVVLEEIRRRSDNPEDDVWRLFMRTVFPNQPLGRDTLGEEGTVAALSRRHCLSYLRKHYQPRNMLVAASGKVRHEEIVALAGKYFSPLAPLERIVPLRAETHQKKPRCNLFYKKTEQAHLRLGFWGLNSLSRDRFVLEVAQALLGRGFSSRLFTKIREERGLAYSVGAYGELYRDTGVFLVYAGLKIAAAAEAVAIILSELSRLKKEVVSPEELQETKERVKGPLLFKLESPDQIVQFLGAQELLTARILTPKEVVKRVEAVTADDLQRVARRLFVPERLNLALIGPFKNERPFVSLLEAV